jgi:hypothetical protein
MIEVSENKISEEDIVEEMKEILLNKSKNRANLLLRSLLLYFLHVLIIICLFTRLKDLPDKILFLPQHD